MQHGVALTLKVVLHSVWSTW